MHSCPTCDEQFEFSHRCTQDHSDPEIGQTASTTTICRVQDDGRLACVTQGSNSLSGLGAVMAMNSPLIEGWYMGQNANLDEIPEAER